MRLSGPCHSLSGRVSLIVVFGVAVSVGLWLLTGALAGPVGLVESAEGPQQLVEVSEDSAAGSANSVVASYARDFSVSYEEAVRRLDRVDELQEIIASIRELEVARLAGWGIDHDGGFGAWVWLVGDELPSPAVARIASGHADLEIRTGAVHSYEELKAAQKQVRSDLPEMSEDADYGSNISTRVVLTGIDLRANSIKVGIDSVVRPRRVGRGASPQPQLVPDPISDEVFEAEVARLSEVLGKSLGVAVKIVDGRGLGPTANFPLQPNVRPEPRTDFRGGDNSMSSCTPNFAAKKIGGDYGLITAGHCHNYMRIRFVFLPYVNGWSSPRADAQFHRIPLRDPAHRLFDDYRCGVNDEDVCDVTGTIARVDMLNKYVCHNGNTSGFSCGTVIDINTRVDHGCTDSDETKEIECEPVMFTFQGPTLMGCKGDSGGPIFDSQGIAYGLLTESGRGSRHSRGSGCREGAWVTGSAVREIEKFLGVEVLTEDPLPPGAPVELAKSIDDDRVSLSWKAPPEGAAQYKVYRRIAASGHEYQEHHTTADTEYVEGLFDLTSGVEYYYRVAAVNNLGMESARSALVSVLVPGAGAAPPDPVGLGAEVVGLNGVRFSWGKPVGDVASYEVYRRAAVKGDPYRKIKTVTSTSFLDPVSGLTAGVEYYYRVKMVSSSGVVGSWGSGSNYARVVMPAVRGLKTNVNSNGVTFSWDRPVGDVASYEVYRRAAVKGDPYRKIKTVTSTSFLDPVSGLTAGVEYYYRVKMVSSSGVVGSWGSGSNYARVVMPAVRGLKTNVNSNGVTFSWDRPVGDVASYEVYRRAAVKGDPYRKIKTVTSTSFLDPVSGLTAGVEYYYRVKMVSSSGVVGSWGSGSNYARVVMPAVRGLKTNVNSNGVTFSWDRPVGDVASFKVFRRIAKPGEVYAEITERKVPYFWDPVAGLTPGVEYYYRVKPVSSAGVVGGWGPGSNYASVRIPAA